MKREIILEKVSKSFAKNIYVKKSSLKIEGGSPIVVFGPSGCGKTTLLKLIAGLEDLDEGEIFINGELVGRAGWNLAPHKRGIGFVFQNSALWPHLTLKENVAFGIKGFSKKEISERVEELFKVMDLSGLEERLPNQISGGQARRVAIARALAVKPEILLLDEPLTNLEDGLKKTILDYILKYVRSQKACLIYVTHDMDEALAIGNEILQMKDGKLEKLVC